MQSLPGSLLKITWLNSSLAEAWLNEGSVNTVIQYDLVFSACDTQGGEGALLLQRAKCNTFIKHLTIGFFGAAEVVFRDLVSGTVYQVSVTASNIAGTSAGITQRHQLLGPPSPPTQVTLDLLGALAVNLSWGLALDSGDGTPDGVPLLGYQLELWTGDNSRLVTLNVSHSTQSFAFRGSIGPGGSGTFEFCANEGARCGCAGLVRIGIRDQIVGSVWSLPLSVQLGDLPASFICVDGTAFNNMEIDGQLECQCSRDAVILRNAQLLTARVRVFSEIGISNYSDYASIMVIDVPAPVTQLGVMSKYVEDSGSTGVMKVTWHAPAITVQHAFTKIIEYHLQISACERDSSNVCSDPDITMVAPSFEHCNITSGECEYVVGSNMLRKGRLYTVRVVAKNAAGVGPIWRAPAFTIAWRVFPTVVAPMRQDFPLRIVEYAGTYRVWLAGLPRTAIMLIVENFPPPPIGKYLPLEIVKSPDGEHKAYGKAEMVGKHYLPSYRQSEDQVSGMGVVCTFILTFPIFAAPWDTWTGTALARLSRDHSISAPTVALDLVYLQYPEAQVLTVLPSVGDIGGGTLVQMLVFEPVGVETRHRAGYPSLLSYPSYSARITLEAEAQSSLSTTLTAQIVSSTNVDLDRIKLVLRMPPCPDPQGGSFRLRVWLGEDETAPSSVKLFTYRSAYILSIVPDVVLATGPQQISIILRGVTFHSISTGENARVLINSVDCSQVEYSSDNAGSRDLRLTAVTPNFQTASHVAAYHAQVSVRVVLKSGTPFILNQTGLLSLVLPPAPVLLNSSISVSGQEAGQLWASNQAPLWIYFTIRHAYVTDEDEFTVLLETFRGVQTLSGAQVAVVPSGQAHDVRFAQTAVTIEMSSNLPEGLARLKASVGGISTGWSSFIEFKDLSQAVLWSAAPKEGRAAGGTLVVLTVSGMCSTSDLCPPPDIQAQVVNDMGHSTPCFLYGALPLSSWKSQDGDYESLMASGGLARVWAAQGSQTTLALSSTLAILEAALADNHEDSLSADTSLIIFAKIPPRPMSRVDNNPNAMYLLQVSAGAKLVESSFSYLLDPTGPARVLQTFPDRVEISGSSLDSMLTVVLSNMAQIHNVSELSITIGGEPVTALSVESSKAQTTVKVMSPRMLSVGQVWIEMYPRFAPQNKASFSIEYYDKNAPEWVATIPYDVYMNDGEMVTGSLAYLTGGDRMTAIISNFGGPDLQPTMVQVWVRTKGDFVQVSAVDVSVSYEAEMSHVTFLAPPSEGTCVCVTVSVLLHQ